jgi:hypothetical protein
MYDGLTVASIPTDAQAVAGYVGGFWPDFSALVAAFPKALHKSVAVNALEDADILDVENGDAVPGEAPAWIQRQLARGVTLPGIYANASTMPAVIAALVAAKIERSLYVLWIASWDGIEAVPTGFQAKQFKTTPSYDVSICAPSFWAQPSPRVTNPVHYDWFVNGEFPSEWGDLDEESVVLHYDGARKHPLKYDIFLKHTLQPQLQFLADRVAYEAKLNLINGKPSWGVDHRGWRFQQLVHRAQGQRFV